MQHRFLFGVAQSPLFGRISVSPSPAWIYLTAQIQTADEDKTHTFGVAESVR